MTLLFANVDCASAQKVAPKAVMQSYELQEVEVTGTRVPLTQKTSAKMVTVLSRSDIQKTGAQSVNDLLKYVTGVDVRQRGDSAFRPTFQCAAAHSIKLQYYSTG
jgi:vitamin B12 transporter